MAADSGINVSPSLYLGNIKIDALDGSQPELRTGANVPLFSGNLSAVEPGVDFTEQPLAASAVARTCCGALLAPVPGSVDPPDLYRAGA